MELLKNDLIVVVEKVFGNQNYFDDEQVEKMLKYISFLKDENEKKNLVSRKATDEEIINRHILSSLLFVKHIEILSKEQEIKRIADIGSGSGFPAIICAICLPEIYFAVVDSIQKKIDFLYDTSLFVGLKNVECFLGRIEDFGEAGGFMDTFDMVTARALGTIELTVEYALPLLKLNGIFLTIKSFQQKEEFPKACEFIKKTGNECFVKEEVVDESYMFCVRKTKEIIKPVRIKKDKNIDKKQKKRF